MKMKLGLPVFISHISFYVSESSLFVLFCHTFIIEITINHLNLEIDILCLLILEITNTWDL